MEAIQPDLSSTVKETQPCQPYLTAMSPDPDNHTSEIRCQFLDSLCQYNYVFKPDLPGYNGPVGPIQTHVRMGPLEPLERKGPLPLYSRNRLTDLQSKFDELE